MKKMNLIFGKKQIILVSLSLILAIALYVQYVFTQSGDELKATGILDGTGLNYGDIIAVSNENTDNYFSQARVDRMNSRSEAVETLKTIFNGGDVTDDEQAVVAQDALEISKIIEDEATVENLIKASGFDDCVVYLDGETANIVVKSEELTKSQAAQIKDILLSVVNVKAENIRLFPHK